MPAAGASLDSIPHRQRGFAGAIAGLIAAATVALWAPAAGAMPLPGLGSAGSGPAVQNEFSQPTSGGATVRADINPEGSDTHYYIQYGSGLSYGSVVPASPADVGSGSAFVRVSQSIFNLQPLHTYHWRVVATNSGGTTDGADQLFATPPPTTPQGAPVATTGSATAITSTGATLNGTVNPSGSATTYHFQYGTTSGYGAVAPVPDGSAGSDRAAHAEQVAVTGLSPNTTYHFRIVASSAGGTSSGADHMFRTARAPAPPAIAVTVTRLSISPNRFTLSGRIVSHRCVVQTRKNQKQRACKRAVALRIAFRLNMAASVKFTVQRIVGGRLVGRRCVAQTRANHRDRFCLRSVPVHGSFSRRMAGGSHRFTWNGRIGGRPLGAGWYYLSAIPAANGHPSKQAGALLLLKP